MRGEGNLSHFALIIHAIFGIEQFTCQDALRRYISDVFFSSPASPVPLKYAL